MDIRYLAGLFDGEGHPITKKELKQRVKLSNKIKEINQRGGI